MLKSIYHLKQTVANKRKSLAKKNRWKNTHNGHQMFREQCALFKYTTSICSAHGWNRIASHRIVSWIWIRYVSSSTSFVSTPNIHAFADKTVLLYTVWIQLWFVCRWARIVLARRLNNKVCSILPIFSLTNYLYRADFHHLFIRCLFLFLKKRVNSDYIFSSTK